MKPTKVLCKRTLALGEDFQYIGFKKIKLDNRMLVEGDWYDVVYNPNDADDTFTIIDNQKNSHLFIMYPEKVDGALGTRDYAKWFFTIQEIREMKLKQLSI